LQVCRFIPNPAELTQQMYAGIDQRAPTSRDRRGHAGVPQHACSESECVVIVLHLLVTDGGVRPDGTFVHLPLHDVATLTEAFRRAVLKMFVNRELLDIETARGMLAWPHSGFHTHDGVWASAGSETTDALDFLAKHTSHIPNQGQVLQRYYGFYSSRQRGKALRKAKRRWANLLRNAHSSFTKTSTRSAETLEVGS